MLNLKASDQFQFENNSSSDDSFAGKRIRIYSYDPEKDMGDSFDKPDDIKYKSAVQIKRPVDKPSERMGSLLFSDDESESENSHKKIIESPIEKLNLKFL